MAIDPSRLYVMLSNTGLQQKDPKLHKFLYELINSALSLTIKSNSSSGSSTIINNITQQLGGVSFESDSADDFIGFSGTSSSSINPITPNGYWSLLTNSDPINPEIVYDNSGNDIAVFTPTNS